MSTARQLLLNGKTACHMSPDPSFYAKGVTKPDYKEDICIDIDIMSNCCIVAVTFVNNLCSKVITDTNCSRSLNLQTKLSSTCSLSILPHRY